MSCFSSSKAPKKDQQHHTPAPIARVSDGPAEAKPKQSTAASADAARKSGASDKAAAAPAPAPVEKKSTASAAAPAPDAGSAPKAAAPVGGAPEAPKADPKAEAAPKDAKAGKPEAPKAEAPKEKDAKAEAAPKEKDAKAEAAPKDAKAEAPKAAASSAEKSPQLKAKEAAGAGAAAGEFAKLELSRDSESEYTDSDEEGDNGCDLSAPQIDVGQVMDDLVGFIKDEFDTTARNFEIALQSTQRDVDQDQGLNRVQITHDMETFAFNVQCELPSMDVPNMPAFRCDDGSTFSESSEEDVEPAAVSKSGAADAAQQQQRASANSLSRAN